MDVNKELIDQLISEEYEKIILAELFSKRSANLEDIVDHDNDPSTDDVLKSEHFQKTLFTDLISGMRNLSNWKVVEKSGSLEDIDNTQEDSFPINYDFDFTYNYKGTPIPLSLIINGSIDISWNGRYRSATPDQPAEHSEPSIDSKYLGDNIDVTLYSDGSKVPLVKADGQSWMTPQIKKNVANAVLSPYL